MLDLLEKLTRVQVGVLCTFVVFVLYNWGPLYSICTYCSWLHLLWSIPPIVFVGGILRFAVEYILGCQGEVPVGDKVVLITGCDTGMGNRLAVRMANKGYKVLAGCLFPEKEDALQLAKMSELIHIIGMDIGSDESMKEAKKIVQNKLGDKQELWAVVANAGVALFSPLEWCSMEDIEKLFNVNLLGTIRTVKTFLPFIRRAKGRLIVTSSMTATICLPYLTAYSMSKIALKSMTQGLYRELSRFGVYCINIEPFFYSTPIVTKMDPDIHRKRFNLLNNEDQKAYCEMLSELDKDMSMVDALASKDLEEPVNVFEHAITSVRPRNGYYTGPSIIQLLYSLSTHFDDHYAASIFNMIF